MTPMIRLAIPLLLPDVPDLSDECVVRLQRLLERRDGMREVHVVDSQLCLHYDPERMTLEQLNALAIAAGAEIGNRYGHLVIPFREVGAEDHGGRIEGALTSFDGVTAASANFVAQTVRVEYDRQVTDRAAIETRLRELGAVPAAVAGDLPAIPSTPAAPTGGPAASWYARNRELAWSLLAGALLLAGWLSSGWSESPARLSLVLFIASYLFGARDNVSHFVADLRKGRLHPNIDLLMVVAAGGAAILGEWREGALLLFLFSLGHAMERYAMGRARSAIAMLAELSPQTATVIRSGMEEEVAITSVRAGDRVVIRPAERIAVDGEVRDGRSAVNQSPITGESIPVDKAPGDQVFAGTVNGEGALVVEVTAAIGDRTLDRVIRLVAEAQTQKAPTQQFTDRFARIFVPLVLIADLFMMSVPPLLGIWSWGDAFYRAMALLVAASPCALALGTPAAVLSGIAQAARNGVLIKGGAHLESLGAITTLALDKTGTITRGEPEVTDLHPAPGVDEAVLLGVTAAVEQRSQHPLARAVLRTAARRKVSVPIAGDLESVTGRGLRSTVHGQRIEVGRLLLFEEAGADIPAFVRERVSSLEAAGRTTMAVKRGDAWLGVIGIADEARSDVRLTLNRLRATGIRRIVMLTGDNSGVGNAVASAVGITEVRAGLLPEDKVTAIDELRREGGVAMVGDGVNDAPALARATVGIAMGGAGTAAALETADVALMGDDLGRLPFAIGLSRASRRVIRQNVAISLSVIALLVVTTTTGVIGIGPAVVVHEGSTLVVVANALRLLLYRLTN
ncbi:MAG: heavy metal translocating P-type ATPase [Gemmatimonadales bacterium]|nr:heavy metal translocating P-type ATPase [Gemmatimonadales bacterium]